VVRPLWCQRPRGGTEVCLGSFPLPVQKDLADHLRRLSRFHFSYPSKRPCAAVFHTHISPLSDAAHHVHRESEKTRDALISNSRASVSWWLSGCTSCMSLLRSMMPLYIDQILDSNFLRTVLLTASAYFKLS
jgi:hypothetical protein